MGDLHSGKHIPFLLVGHLLFIGLAILAVLHWQARVIHVDSAYQIFKWVHQHGVGVEAYRFSAVLPQLLVKLAKTLGASLRTLLIAASLGHVLVPYGIFILLAHVLHRPWIAAASALAAVLCTRLTFYGIVLEANYLLCYPFLLAGLLDRSANGWKRIAPWIALSLVAVLTVHPVGFLIALYVLVLNGMRHPGHTRPHILLVALVLAWAVLGRLLFPPTGYETGLYKAALAGLTTTSAGTNPALEFLIGHSWRLTHHYLPLWIVLLITMVLLTIHRQYRILLLMVGAFMGYAALNILTYHAGEAAMMMEKNFVPLATIVALPALQLLGTLPMKRKALLAIPYLAVIFLQFRGISFASRPTNERLAHIRSLVEKCRKDGLRKACVQDRALDQAGLHIHWALAFETLLLSSLEGPEGSISIVARPDRPPTTTGADLGGLIAEGDICGNGNEYFRLPKGAYGVGSRP